MRKPYTGRTAGRGEEIYREKKDKMFIVSVVRGESRRKTERDRKRHPTYDLCIRVREEDEWLPALIQNFFFDAFRQLNQGLAKIGVSNEGPAIVLTDPFPPSHQASSFGFSMDETALSKRCFLLNAWMKSVIVNFPRIPHGGQLQVLAFLQLGDFDSDSNKTR